MSKKIHIWYRKDRRKWYGQYRLNGKRHTKSFANKEQAHQWKTYMDHKFNYEQWQGINGVTWPLLMKLYMDHKKSQGLARKTIVEIRHTLKLFNYHTDEIRNGVSDLLKQYHIEQYVLARIKDVSARTVNKDLEALRAMYLWAKDCGYVHEGIKFQMLKTVQKQYKPPTKETVKYLFDLAKEESMSLYVRMVLAVVTGLRRSAIERLTLNNTQEAHIDIEQCLLVTIESKTHKQIIKKLGPNTMKILYHHIASLPDGSTKLFSTGWTGNVRKAWKRVRQQAGLPKMTFHNLRNLSVSILADKGESGAVLQKHVEHKSFATTSRYIGLSDETQDRVTKKLDGLFE